MAIFGINFNNFGSRKLRIDSQKRNILFGDNNNSDKKTELETEEKEDKKVQNLIYSVPNDYRPYIPVNPSRPPKTKTNDVPMLIYATPPIEE